MPKKDQATNYCEKHKQEYYAFLDACPVCVGEKIDLKGLRESEKEEPIFCTW